MKPTSMDKIIPIRDAFLAYNDHYDNGGSDYSVTEILDGPRVVHLNKRHGGKVVPTVMQNKASFMGTAMHDFLEKMLRKSAIYQGDPNIYVCEERLEFNFLGRSLSGAYDITHHKQRIVDLYDLKTTNCRTMIRNKGFKADWVAQQNIYRYLYYLKYNIPIEHLYIIGLFWDWNPFGKWQIKEPYLRKYYPDMPFVEISLPIWESQTTLKFIQNRLKPLIKHESSSDDYLPHCTTDDMWSQPDKYAVKLKGRSRALTAQCNSKQEAKDYIYEHQYNNDTKLQHYSIDYRPARRIRCEDWCPVRSYCNQWHEYNSSTP